MTVPQIASLAATIDRTLGNQNAGVASSVRNLLSASASGTAVADTSGLADASFLQTQVASLHVASQNIAQAQSLLGVANEGTTQIAQVLGQLQDLSTQAQSSGLSDSERNQLNIQFQQLRAQINRIASTTQFGGQNLLDGSLGGNALGGDSTSSTIGALTDQQLFGSGTADLSSAADAANASQVVAKAQDYVETQQSNIGALGEGLGYAAATIESATQNQNAAQSALGDNDFAGVATQSAQAQLQAQATSSLLAQTSKLPAGVLQLLNE